MRTMMGIESRKFVSMRITVSMKSAKFCPNLYNCAHSNGIQFRHCAMYTHIPKRRFIKDAPPSGNRKNTKKLRFRWQASQKCTFLLLSGVPEPHMPPSGGRKSGDDNIVNAAKVDSWQRCRNSKLSKEGLLSKQNTTCTLK